MLGGSENMLLLSWDIKRTAPARGKEAAMRAVWL